MVHHIRDAWLVLVLALGFGIALATVQGALAGRIAENQRAETYAQIPKLVPGADSNATEEVTVAGVRVYRAMAGGKQLGWVVPARGQGFADVIQILVGLDAGAETLTGLYVQDQKETPGLGNKIEADAWRAQFQGKSTASPIEATKGQPAGNQIAAVTGATISSVSVCDIVNGTVGRLKAELARERRP